jgi:hypothetical protein
MSQPSLGAQKLLGDANLEQRHEGTSGALEGLAGERDDQALNPRSQNTINHSRPIAYITPKTSPQSLDFEISSLPSGVNLFG